MRVVDMVHVPMKHIITKEYIYSYVYDNTMLKYVNSSCNLFNQHENVKNFDYRMSKLRGLGAWRWLSTFRHRYLIADFVFSKQQGIDFGGHHAPIYGNTEIIDIYPEHFYRKIRYISDEELDYIFTSHTLEHVKELPYTLREFTRILKPAGYLICIVPSWNCERWRAGGPNTHLYTFGLENDSEWINIEKLISNAGFNVLKAEYTYDNSIIILATKCVD